MVIEICKKSTGKTDGKREGKLEAIPRGPDSASPKSPCQRPRRPKGGRLGEQTSTPGGGSKGKQWIRNPGGSQGGWLLTPWGTLEATSDAGAEDCEDAVLPASGHGEQLCRQIQGKY